LQTPQKTEAARGAATLVVAQSPRYYPHVERHLNGLKKVFPEVRLLYWEKDPSEPIYALPGVACERLILPFGKGGTLFFLRLMAGFLFLLLKRTGGKRARGGRTPETIEAIDPYALIPARLYALRQSLAGRATRLIYFSMEYFSALPSLRAKPIKRRIWSALERWGARRAAAGATVCDSIAAHLREDFGIPIVTVRNVPYRTAAQAPTAVASADNTAAAETRDGKPASLHARCGLPADSAILIYQGMLQEGRGLESAVRAVAMVPGVHFAVIGGGPLLAGLRALARAGGCEDRVHLLGEVDFRDLVGLTRGAFAGLAPFQALSASYLYSLPGKLFEYIQAGVPVIATALPEIRKVVDGYGVGICLDDEKPETLAAALRRLSEEPGLRAGFLRNLPAAQAELCWEAEEIRYLELYP
jgi:glycosyltransferase involved in cell wall biosynthesis